MPALDEAALHQIFLDARTHSHWLEKPVADETLRRLSALAHLGPTSANMTPLRVLFVKSAAAKEKLRPALSPGNVDKTMAAPATAIIAHDLAFYEHADTLLPGREFKPKLLAMTPEKRLEIAKQSSTLQAGYLIIAARALGLDAGPMGGFDPAKVDEAFFAGTAWRSSLLVNLGYGDASKLRPRNPRLAFEDVGRIE